MLFAWHFDEGQPAPGQAKQPPIVNDEALHRRRLYAKVLAEPVLSSRGFTAVPGGGGAPNDEDSGPTSEGFTPLLSNGDELLRLTEHSRVVIDNVVDAPRSLLVSGDVGKDARKWQERISWFQVRVYDLLRLARRENDYYFCFKPGGCAEAWQS